MEFISERISTERQGEAWSVVIATRLPKGQQALLLAWVVAWTLCGAVFFLELFKGPPPTLRAPLLIMLAFWAYFEFRTVRVFLWRKSGYEIWRVMDGELVIKNSLFRYGRADRYFIANIQRLGPLKIDRASWKWQMSDSFWTRGAEQLGFEYQGRKVAFGRGLTEEEAGKLVRLVAAELKHGRKAAQ